MTDLSPRPQFGPLSDRPGQLALYDDARRALAEAHRFDEAKSIHDKAVAMQAYAKQAQDTELIRYATEIRLRAERRAGELLIKMTERGERAGQGEGGGKGRKPQPLLKLADLRVSKTESSRWQATAQIPKDKFERNVERAGTEAYDRLRGAVTGVATAPHDERGHDVYETPAAAVWSILAGRERFPGAIWEPACCRGNIVRVLRLAGYRVVASDLVDYGFPGAESGVDFLKQTSAPAGVETIITNPPFMHADEFVRRALKLVPRVVMLLRVLFLESEGRSDVLETGLLARVHVFRERIEMHRDGWTGSRASSQLGLAWYEWDRNYNGPIILDRISCQEPPNEAPADAAGDDIRESVGEGFAATPYQIVGAAVGKRAAS